MCDPVTLLGGALIGAGASKLLKPKGGQVAASVDPAAERAKAEAEATQRANATIVADQRRRRASRGLLSLGVDDQSGLGVTGQSARGGALAAGRSLLSLGTGAYNPASAGSGMPGAYYGGAAGGGRSGNTRQQAL